MKTEVAAITTLENTSFLNNCFHWNWKTVLTPLIE